MTESDVLNQLNEDEKRFLVLQVATVFWNGVPWGRESYYKNHIPHLMELGLIAECSWYGVRDSVRLSRDGMSFMLRNYEAFGDEFKRDYKPGGKIDKDKQFPRWRAAALESHERFWLRDEQKEQEARS